ncbi:MAG: SDR family NAD(P)-dependent oxidoreductase [Spirochaetales bacterium]|nr:SDR family NAD(P)-dependent oxidoreductase [Leptospiraceae bacterium]MCP5482329.1 SDR family NAD(P)-dependent oxidoreductase [Spirochaetales bacterium]MCP5484232.1 SDR family NAD(P)-dependent oxidoreductase [Spirochaetales bacterium]
MRKTVLITGATDGIGLETAAQLAELGNRILLHGRNAARGRRALEAVQRRATDPDQHRYVQADLADLDEVRALATQLAGENIDVLINNAGVFMNERKLSRQGYEMTFAVNHLAHFLLTTLLLERIPDGGRVITLSSIAHSRASLDFDNLQLERGFSGYAAYATSKLLNAMFARELADRVRARRIDSNSVHPGVITTKLLKTGFNMGGADLAEGAATSVYLAQAAEVAGVTGRYFANKKPTRSNALVEDAAAREQLWKISAGMCRA